MIKPYYRRFVFVFWVLVLQVIPQAIFAQNTSERAIDSINLELTKELDDTTRVTLLHQLADKLRATSPEESQRYLDRSGAILHRISWNKGIGENYFLRGKLLGLLGNCRQAITYFDSALYFLEHTAETYTKIKSGIFKGICYKRLNDYSAAYRAFQDALSTQGIEHYPLEYLDINESIATIYDRMGNTHKAIAIYRNNEKKALSQNFIEQAMISKTNLGQSLAGIGLYDEGLAALLEALEYFKHHNMYHHILATMVNIAYVYGSIENYEEALQFLLKAQALSSKSHSKYEPVLIRKNLSQVYLKIGDTAQALQELEGVLEDYISLGDSIGLAKTHQLIGNFYNEGSQPEQAIHSYLIALSIGEQFKNAEFNLKIHISLARTHYTLKQHRRAEAYFNAALELADSMNLIEEIGQIYSYKYKIAEQRGAWKEAYLYLKEHFKFKDSLNIQKQVAEINKLQFTYESALKDEEILRLEADGALKQLQLKQKDMQFQNSIVLFVVVLLVIMLLVLFVYHRKKSEFRAQKAELSLKVLRSQMNPHFIFNALTSIHGFVMSNQSQVASDYLIKFSKLMRKVLQSSYQDLISIEEEVAMLSLYLQLESCRLNHKFTFNIEVDTNLNSAETLIPPLLIQPFVENAVWHGVANSAKKGHISVRIQSQGETLLCEIEDNGVGREFTRKNKLPPLTLHRSLGLSITRERLKMLAQQKQQQSFNIEFEDLSPGLRATLSIPITMQF